MSELLKQIIQTFPQIDYKTWSEKFEKDYETFFKNGFDQDHFVIHPLQSEYDAAVLFSPLKNLRGFGKFLMETDGKISQDSIKRITDQEANSFYLPTNSRNQKMASDWPEIEILQQIDNDKIYFSHHDRVLPYHISPLGTLKERWNNIKTFVENLNTTNMDVPVMAIELDNFGLQQVALMRAAKILVANYFEGETPIIIGKGAYFQEVEHWHDQLLINAYYALIMAYGDVDFYSFQYFNAEDVEEVLYHINLVNLLKYEFGFEEKRDVLAGSYYIENLTYKILHW